MGSQPVTSVRDETYGDTADNAIAFAEEFDTLWDGASLDVVQYEAILDSCTSYWRGRLPQSSVPSEYEGICDALITMVNEVDATAIAAGATPPAWPPAGEGGGDVAPLTRVRYVDGDASGVTGPNGAAVVGQTSGGPFPTVSAALAAFGVSTSTLDAETNVSVYVAPSAVSAHKVSPPRSEACPKRSAQTPKPLDSNPLTRERGVLYSKPYVKSVRG